MSTLLLAPFNDSMRLGQGYNSFLQTPCVANAVDISNATLVESQGGSVPSQTVSYSARFVEKMSDVVHAMNISAGSSIRTGSVSISGGGNNIDEIKFAESDLNAVISVKVVNQTRNLRENIKFEELKVKDMNSSQFHDIYGDTFISGFIEGGDLHGIISIKTIDASKKTEVKNNLKRQFNGQQSTWSPSSTAELNEALRQAEVTVTVNWSGGGTIKPANEDWTIDSLIRASSTFPDNVAQCPQRTWAILTRYDTVPQFVIWSWKFTPRINVRRYEGVQRFTSELLDMYIEYKSNLIILNDAIRHQDDYERSPRPDGVDMALSKLLEARKSLRGEMTKIVRKIEALNNDPAVINEMVGEQDVTAPELWRARLPFRKDTTSKAITENVLESLFKGLPIHAEIGKQPDLSTQLDAKTLQMKLTQLEQQNKVLADNLSSANKELIELKNKPKPPVAEAVTTWWVKDGLCPPDQMKEMPRCIREWAAANATKWADCRVSWQWSGLDDAAKDGSSQFKCSLDDIGPEDGHVHKLDVFFREKYICGLRILYTGASKKIVEHGDCTAPHTESVQVLCNDSDGISIAGHSGTDGRPQELSFCSLGSRFKMVKCKEQRSWAGGHIVAPPGYLLRGFWTQYEGDGFERLGFIWGDHAKAGNPHVAPDRSSARYLYRP